MSVFDKTQRFLFDHTNIRGEITVLDSAYKEVLSKHNYPEPVAILLGQFMAAAAMLSDTIKFDGSLSLQVKGSGQVRTLMAECRDHRAVRAIAQYNDDFDANGAILGEGQMAITIEPKHGQRYQGMVMIDDNNLTLSTVLEDYFQKSEQIRTRIWLFANKNRAAGFMLQAMPISASESSLDIANQDTDAWDRAAHLAETLTEEEILTLPAEDMLHRLFHEEKVRLYPAHDLEFECTCNAERTGNAIHMLGEQDALSLVAEQGHILIDCQFCHQRYAFNSEDVAALFSKDTSELN